MMQRGQAEETRDAKRATRNEKTRRIELQHFSVFREARGCSSETVATSAGTPRELFGALDLDEVFPLDERRLRVALNDEFASWDDPLESGDVVVFLAPSSGG